MTAGAYRFLAPAGRAPFSDFRWPLPENGEPGPWVEATGPLALCADGIHACPPESLTRWLAWELWSIELGGDVAEHGSVLLAGRGRLLRRIPGWNAELARSLMEDCIARTQSLAEEQPESQVLAELRAEVPGYVDGTYFDDMIESVAMGTYVVGRAASVAAAPDGDLERHEAGFDAERRRQSLWLAEQLGLPGA